MVYEDFREHLTEDHIVWLLTTDLSAEADRETVTRMTQHASRCADCGTKLHEAEERGIKQFQGHKSDGDPVD